MNMEIEPFALIISIVSFAVSLFALCLSWSNMQDSKTKASVSNQAKPLTEGGHKNSQLKDLSNLRDKALIAPPPPARPQRDYVPFEIRTK